jgi:hypothetical protein
MAGRKRPRSADRDPSPPTRKSSRVRVLTQHATVPPPSQAELSGARTSARLATASHPIKSTSAQGKSSIIPPPTAGSSRGSGKTLKNSELALEVLKIVDNEASADLMILSLIDKYSFSFSHLKELLRGELSQSPPFCHTESQLG